MQKLPQLDTVASLAGRRVKGDVVIHPFSATAVTIYSCEDADGSSYSTEINGVSYEVRAHFYKRKDGSWDIGDPENGSPEYHSLTVRRRWEPSFTRHDQTDASWAARKQIALALNGVFAEWLNTAAKELARAEVARRVREYQGALAEEEGAKKKWQDASGRSELTKAQLEDAEVALAKLG